MRSPQVEDGFTRIANEILEALVRVSLSRNEWRVLMVVVRQTYGYGKKTDSISLSQFSRATGMMSHNAYRALKSLEAKKMIIVQHGRLNCYSFQKDYSLWTTLRTDTIGTDSIDTDSATTIRTDRYKRKKENKESTSSHSPIVQKTILRLNASSGKSFRPESASTQKYIMARLKEGFTEEDLLAVVEDRVRRWKDDPKMDQYLRPSTLFNPEKFEAYLQEARRGQGHHKPVVKDLSDGWLEVDEKRMTRETYERRYGKK